MINKELLEYVKKRLSENVNKEDLIIELTSGGWTKNDIEESIREIKFNNIIENNSNKTSKLRKIFFPIFSSPIIIFFLLNYFNPAGGSGLKFAEIPLIISSFILIFLGYKKSYLLWYIFFILLSLSTVLLPFRNHQIDLFPLLLTTIIISSFILLLTFKITNFYYFYNEKPTIKREIVLFLILLLLPIFANIIWITHDKAMTLNRNMKEINYYALPDSYDSLDECVTKKTLEESGYCYGYFVNKSNQTCHEYLDGNNLNLSAEGRGIKFDSCYRSASIYRENNWFIKNYAKIID
ncbi:MAG: hypothetical protein PHN69_01190 [Candidatus Pacebacteria bacterium]|nr:hypothetical protein [Candidatus Paceibacterota bacterium]